MQPGPKPDPTNLKLAKGYKDCEVNKNEPKPKKLTKIPPAPHFLCQDARKEWRRVAKELYKLGLLTSLDRAAMVAYCQAWARMKQAEEALAKPPEEGGGLTCKTSNGNVIQNPLVGTVNRCIEQVRKLAETLGMTPSARSRISVAPPVDDLDLD